jgi:predicted dehydrogenase
VLTWLCAMFGPARQVTAFASVLMPDKGIAVDAMAPDFTVGCLEFDDGIIARVTCGLTAPRDKSITVVGDNGTLSVGTVRDDHAPVMWKPAVEGRLESMVRRRARPLHRWLQARLGDAGLSALVATRYGARRSGAAGVVSADKPVDFLRGLDDLADAIDNGREPRLSADLSAHVVELVERLQYPERFTNPRVTTAFRAIDPMPWAR